MKKEQFSSNFDVYFNTQTIKGFLSVNILVALLLCSSLLFASLPVAAQTLTNPTLSLPALKGTVQATTGRPYRVGPGDILSVQVYNQGEFTQPEVNIGPDGYATFNNVGPIYVAGKTLPEIQAILFDSISQWVKVPNVSVGLTRTRPGILYVNGAVLRPGLVQMATDPKSLTGGAGGPANGFRAELRLTNALQTAGGVMASADLSKVTIKRAETGTTETYDLWKLLREGDNTQDVLLQQGDSVIVPELENSAAMSDEDFMQLVRSSIGPGSFPIRIFGYVAKPGNYDMNGLSPYLNSALSRAEGYAAGANRKVIAIRRFTNSHNFTTLFINPEKADIALRPNDIVWVSERRVYATGRFFSTVANVFAPFTNVATSAALVISTKNN
jgi:protein involved in polysaccharide export with SLBB domain